jgi:hypothetical protein
MSLALTTPRFGANLRIFRQPPTAWEALSPGEIAPRRILLLTYNPDRPHTRFDLQADSLTFPKIDKNEGSKEGSEELKIILLKGTERQAKNNSGQEALFTPLQRIHRAIFGPSDNQKSTPSLYSIEPADLRTAFEPIVRQLQSMRRTLPRTSKLKPGAEDALTLLTALMDSANLPAINGDQPPRRQKPNGAFDPKFHQQLAMVWALSPNIPPDALQRLHLIEPHAK